jgi:hypothetical protein
MRSKSIAATCSILCAAGLSRRWYWQEATERTERILGNLGVFGPPSAVALDDERKYTQADMERFGKAYADARDARCPVAQPVEQTGAPVAWRIEQRAGRYTFVEHVENLKLYAGANIVPLFRAFRSVDSILNSTLDRLESMVTWEPRLLTGPDAIDRLEHINRLLYELLNAHPTAQPVEQTRALERIGYATLHHGTVISVRLADPTPTDFIAGYSGADVFIDRDARPASGETET